jgi:hypothetical protein
MPVKLHVGQGAPDLPFRIVHATTLFESGDRFPLRQIAKRQAATFAARVLEVQRLPAILTLK